VVLYILSVMIISKIFSFIYDGYTAISVISFLMGIIFIIGLYFLQRVRKNQLDYNL
jgi:energy-converting hydrogenase Eha subunit F